jgi:hypothetical protein
MADIARTEKKSERTIEAYQWWTAKYIRFHRMRTGRWIDPRQQNAPDIRLFLRDLAVDKQLSGASIHIAMNALIYLYHKVLDIKLDPLNVDCPNKRVRVPTR